MSLPSGHGPKEYDDMAPMWHGGRRSGNSRKLAESVQWMASLMGHSLQQTYQMHEAQWWLFTHGKPARPLEEDEIQWHRARNHAPFVEGGVTPDSPDWWKEPEP